jgi:hypothetical protein
MLLICKTVKGLKELSKHRLAACMTIVGVRNIGYRVNETTIGQRSSCQYKVICMLKIKILIFHSSRYTPNKCLTN